MNEGICDQYLKKISAVPLPLELGHYPHAGCHGMRLFIDVDLASALAGLVSTLSRPRRAQPWLPVGASFCGVALQDLRACPASSVAIGK